MDFETDEELEEEMTHIMENMIMPMLEGTGEVPMTGLMFPDMDNLSEDIKASMPDDAPKDKKAMFIVPSMGAPDKDAFYAILSHIARDNKVRNTMFFSDSWLSKKPVEDFESGDLVMPSEDPERVDALMLHYVNTDINGILLKNAMMCQEYESVDGKIIYGERSCTITDNTTAKSGDMIGSRITDALSNNDWA